MSEPRTEVALVSTVIAAAAVALFGQAAYTAWPPDDPLDLATAVGTVGAVVVALWLALREDARRRKEDIERAEIAAAAALVRIEMQRTICRVLAPELAELPYTLDRASNLSSALQRAGIVPSELITALTPLPNKCAARLARSQSLLAWCDRELKPLVDNAPANRVQVEVPIPLVQHWKWSLEEAHRELEQVIVACAHASQRPYAQ